MGLLFWLCQYIIYFLDFSQASHSTGIIPELSDQLCPFQKGEVVLYTISADADFRCQTVRIRKPSQLILLPILYAAEIAIEIFAEISFGLLHIAIRFVRRIGIGYYSCTYVLIRLVSEFGILQSVT